MHRRAAVLGLSSLIVPCGTAHASVPPAFMQGLSQRLRAAAEVAPGELCVTVRDFSTNHEVYLNGDTFCPMHSVIKVFIGAYTAREIAAGRWSNDQKVMLDRASAPNGHGRVDVRVARAGRLEVSLGDMLEAMLIDSDNISADGLMRLAGGPGAIHASLNLPDDIHMNQSLRDQLKPFGMAKNMTTFDRFMADPRDQATPRAFMLGLMRLANGQLGGAVADERVLRLMRAAWRGKARLPAGLGPDWLTFGRTGTGQPVGGRTTAVLNVVIALHKRTGRKVAIVAFLKDARGGLGSQEAAIARVGRAVRETWAEG